MATTRSSLMVPFASAVAAAGGMAYFAASGNEVGLAVGAAGLVTASEKTVRRVLSRLPQPRWPLRGAQHLKGRGCQQIYDHRQEAMPDIVRALWAELNRGHGRILIWAISGRGFLHDNPILNPRDDLLIPRHMGELAAKFRGEVVFLVLDPDCPEARRRQSFETGIQTIPEIRISVDNFKTFFGEKSNVSMGLYKLRPWRFVVMTEAVAFVEDYLSAPPTGWPGGYFGGLCPVYSFPVGTEGYRQAEGEATDLLRSDEIRWVKVEAPSVA